MENFIDAVKIKVISGKGGNGAISFLREKFLAFGGPDGGDGGNGGNILFVCSRRRYDLLHLRYKKILRAADGQRGKRRKAHGRNGKNSLIEVPPGSILSDVNNINIHEFKADGEEFLFLPGGQGGKGNTHFRSSKNKAPRMAEKGKLGREVFVNIEMKLLAHVAFVGLPNAGKSTLLRKLTASRAKVGNYPFTTLSPNLGMYHVNEEIRLILADIPGIIAGSSLGKGLGLNFLRHIDRSSVVFYIIDSSLPSAFKTFLLLEKEQEEYYKQLGKNNKKPYFVLLSKVDSLQAIKSSLEDQKKAILKPFLQKIPAKHIAFISSHSLQGFSEIYSFLRQAAEIKNKV